MEGQDGDSASVENPAGGIKDRFEVVVECSGEAQQQQVFEKLSGEGLKCRVLTV